MLLPPCSHQTLPLPLSLHSRISLLTYLIIHPLKKFTLTKIISNTYALILMHLLHHLWFHQLLPWTKIMLL